MKKSTVLFLLMSMKMMSQISGNATSTIACNSNSSTITFTVSSGTAPYSFTVQTPSCTSNYTFGSSSSNSTFTFSCPGVYSITAKDASNNLLGSVNHTVVLSNFIMLDVLMDADDPDSICAGRAVMLYGHLVNPIAWSTGESMPSIFVSPSVTTTYSFSGTYDAAGSRTCVAKGYKTIVVLPCTVNINEVSESINLARIYPNPVGDKFKIDFDQANVFEKIIITDALGKIVFVSNNVELKKDIDITYLLSGIYYLVVKDKESQKVFKIIKE